jgi:hypothetical protein
MVLNCHHPIPKWKKRDAPFQFVIHLQQLRHLLVKMKVQRTSCQRRCVASLFDEIEFNNTVYNGMVVVHKALHSALTILFTTLFSPFGYVFFLLDMSTQ